MGIKSPTKLAQDKKSYNDAYFLILGKFCWLCCQGLELSVSSFKALFTMSLRWLMNWKYSLRSHKS